MKRVIVQSQDQTLRVVEFLDQFSTLADLKGDVYNPQVNPDISPEDLAREEAQFDQWVETNGVYAYSIERWDPTPNGGWTYVDACYGLVGQHVDDFFSEQHHAVVGEFVTLVKEAK